MSGKNATSVNYLKRVCKHPKIQTPKATRMPPQVTLDLDPPAPTRVKQSDP